MKENMLQKLKSKAGFTMIELLVVATIIVVLSAIGLVSYRKATENSRNAKRESDMETVRQALVLYKVDVGSYPNDTYDYDSVAAFLVTQDYLSSPYPTDPKSGFSYTYAGVAGGASFTLTATLEPSPGAGTYLVTNP